MNALKLTPEDPLSPGRIPLVGAEGWCERSEERRETDISAKVIRSTGASLNVTITDMSASGLRLEGAEGLSIGEKVLVLLPDSNVIEVKIRWAFNDHAGVKIVD